MSISDLNPSIFRAYDIRGNSLSSINPTIAYKIGFGLAKLSITVANNKICVGRDGRLSSPDLYQGLVNGLVDAGASVISIGVVPTPMVYFADKHLSPAASVMITGSHNPKDDNGFKMLSHGKSFFGPQIQELLAFILGNDWSQINLSKRDVIEKSVSDEYLSAILKQNIIKPSLKVAWDPGNGAGSHILTNLVSELSNTNIVINNEIDGTFPNHHPDPTVPENLVQLIDVVKKESCDLGIAFDGDADRIGVVTTSGKIVWGDQLLALFAEDILKTKPGATIIADVKASQILFDQVAYHGGKPLMWKTGHSLIKTKMAETNAVLAGEMSGHMFFADRYYGYDDAIYAALRLLDLLSKSTVSLDEMINKLPVVYNTPEIRIEVPDEEKFNIIDCIKLDVHGSVNDVDGLRVTNENGWWLLRASNTQAAIIARCEAGSLGQLKKLKLELCDILSKKNIDATKFLV